jgi:hypothetical protein
MAVLKKHGVELLRIKKIDQPHPDLRATWSERITERAYMSDGWVLSKRAYRRRDTNRIEPGTWKLANQVKPGISPQQLAEARATQGWTVESITHLCPTRPIIAGPLIENAERFNQGLSDQTQFEV